MSTYRATIEWRGDSDFLQRRYSRAHNLIFDGLTVPGSSSPHVVPLPYSREDALDPEEAFTASLSSCHMLWFLDFACRAGFEVAAYRAEAEGTLARDAEGKMAMTQVVLRPAVEFTGRKLPTPAEIEALHHKAHEACFIANSVKTEVRIEPRPAQP
jgi:organic hydroperoxide reductase OsmC/OhrA